MDGPFFVCYIILGILPKTLLMPQTDPYKILGLKPGAEEKEVKLAYRRLALKYHPDMNPDPSADERFREIQEAYDSISEGRVMSGVDAAYSWDEVMEELRRDRERKIRQARARQAKKKQEEDFFNKEEWHDFILFFRYFFHTLAILLGIAAVIFPVVLAVIVSPASLVGTVFFLISGGVLLYYIYSKRKTWFRLGAFKFRLRDIRASFKKPVSHPSSDTCLYSVKEQADGKPVRLEMIFIEDIKVRTFGAMNHQASYKSKVKHIVMPRSSRAQYWHRMSSYIKLLVLLAAIIFVPFESILWRFIAGLFAGACLSLFVLKLAGVREKSTYLLTPELIIKMVIWLAALFSISDIGPGFTIQLSSAVYIVVAGLLFLLDMLFDLLMGLFPFYRKLFFPLVRQGEIMTGLYRDGYQNYLEIPFYSVLYPLFKWLF